MSAIHVDVSAPILDLRHLHKSLSKKRFDRIVTNSINHTLRKTKTATSKQIKAVYGARSKDVKKGLKVSRANTLTQSGAVVGFGRPLPLIAFRARQNKKGVSVRIMGRSRLINKAFIATMPSGHKGVFARGQYKGGEFRFRKKRVKRKGNDLVINELNTVSVPRAMSNNIILNNLSNQMNKDFPERLTHLLSRG